MIYIYREREGASKHDYSGCFFCDWWFRINLRWSDDILQNGEIWRNLAALQVLVTGFFCENMSMIHSDRVGRACMNDDCTNPIDFCLKWLPYIATKIQVTRWWMWLFEQNHSVCNSWFIYQLDETFGASKLDTVRSENCDRGLRSGVVCCGLEIVN